MKTYPLYIRKGDHGKWRHTVIFPNITDLWTGMAMAREAGFTTSTKAPVIKIRINGGLDRAKTHQQ